MEVENTHLDTQPAVAKKNPYTVLLTGGGTAGHITPILAVAHELKLLDPSCRIVYIGERNGKFAALTDDSSLIDEIYTIYAGKFRRYHGESWLKRLLDLKTLGQNSRDAVYVCLGFFQSRRLLKLINPSIILLKGGYVGMPVGLAAASRQLPFVTHDSDALPGLANKIVSKWATLHATGMPAEFYQYPSEKVQHVGVLVGEAYQPVSSDLQKKFKQELHFSEDSTVLLVTGGSLGAQRINHAMTAIVPRLLHSWPHLEIVHQVGKGNADAYGPFVHERLHVLEFMVGMHRYSGAADVVVTRAGANTLAELGVQGRACIVVANPVLTGGHQIKNAEYLTQKNAVLTVPESPYETNADALRAKITELIQNQDKRDQLGKKLQSITIPDAAHKLALLLMNVSKL